MENKSIKLEDFKNDKEKCPYDGNKIFLTYNTIEGIPSSLRCTYCLRDFEFNGKDEYIEAAFLKNKVDNFTQVTGIKEPIKLKDSDIYHENPEWPRGIDIKTTNDPYNESKEQ